MEFMTMKRPVSYSTEIVTCQQDTVGKFLVAFCAYYDKSTAVVFCICKENLKSCNGYHLATLSRILINSL